MRQTAFIGRRKAGQAGSGRGSDGRKKAFHQNKEHWNSIILDGTAPEKDVKGMIAESYDLVTA